MSVGLDQPSTSNMGQANYNFGGQGSRNDGDQQQQPSRSYTPAESIHSGTKARIIATFLWVIIRLDLGLVDWHRQFGGSDDCILSLEAQFGL